MQVARASSFSCSRLDTDDQLERRLKGQIEGIGTRPRLFAKGMTGETLIDETWPAAEVGLCRRRSTSSSTSCAGKSVEPCRRPLATALCTGALI